MTDLTWFLTDYGYISLFITSFLASTVLPLGSEGLVVLMVLGDFNVYTVVMVASIANFLGSCTSYYVGYLGRKLVMFRYMRISEKEIRRAENIFSKYGAFSLLFTWLPGIGDVLTVVAGTLKYRFDYFTILVFAGKLFRYTAVAYIASQF